MCTLLFCKLDAVKRVFWSILLVFAVVSFSGCLTSSKTVAANTAKTWMGRDVANFFLEHGAPISEFTVNADTKMYKWTKGYASYSIPMSAQTTMIGNQAFTNVYGGGTAEMGCAAEITAVKGKITKMVFEDSLGAWRISRCDEVLNP